MCEDVKATLSSLSTLGVHFERTEDCLTVSGKDIFSCEPSAPLSVGASASTLRFLIPLALLLKCEMTFVGEPSLFCRPLTVYEELFASLRCPFRVEENRLHVNTSAFGELPEVLQVDADISSQFITGLLFLYALSGGGKIVLSKKVASRPYIDLTLYTLSLFGVRAFFEGEHTIVIPKGQKLVSSTMDVEGDDSGSAYVEALNLLGGEVTIGGLPKSTFQGDHIYHELFPLLEKGAPVLDIVACPDLAPILMALASHFHGATLLSTDRLKIKESDRATAMATELSKFGANIELCQNKIVIHPSNLHSPTEKLNGHRDHRIVMALSVLLTRYGGQITDGEAVAKSYPQFFQDLQRLGIEIHSERR